MKNLKNLPDLGEEVTNDLKKNPGIDETNDIELFISRMQLQNHVLKKLTENLKTNFTTEVNRANKE